MTAAEDADVLVVGAGLAGLALAWRLQRAGRDVVVLEAQPRAGGRIRSVLDGHGGWLGDLGPTWIWTAQQPVARRWLQELGLEIFEQHERGLAVYEPGPAEPPVEVALPAQHGSMRVVGGSGAIVRRLLSLLPAGTVRTSCPVAAIDAHREVLEVRTAADPPASFRARRLVVATPARLAVHALSWRPALPAALARALAETPTWMAPHAKAVIRYRHPFWRDRGLSGRVASRVGPLVEAHDHCGPGGAPAALFGFVGWPPAERARRGAAALVEAVAAQLGRCFGADAPAPLAIDIADWALESRIAAPADLSQPMDHPAVRADILRQPHLDGRLRFCGAETALRSPGLIEGAFDAAERTAAAMLDG